MRHVYTNRVVILISVLLAGAAVLWAWRQSRPSAAREQTAAAVATPRTDGSALGRDVYARACISCHAPDDAAHAAPARLRAQTLALLRAEGGRAYLANLMLYGAAGQRMTAPGTRRFRHPPFAELSDREIAEVLNVLPAEVPEPVWTAGEIARLRETPLSPEQVATQRPATP